ncbi:MAG: VOC family protein, partial [Methyloceanibacter sp.]
MKLNPYLNFDGTCQDAMETCAKILGGEILTLMRFDEMPGDQGFPPEMAKKIAHARLKIGESILMASHA